MSVDEELIIFRSNLEADKFFLMLLWAHVPFSWLVVPYGYGTEKEGLILSLILASLGTLSYIFSRGTFLHRLLNGIILIICRVIYCMKV